MAGLQYISYTQGHLACSAGCRRLLHTFLRFFQHSQTSTRKLCQLSDLELVVHMLSVTALLQPEFDWTF